MTTVAFQGDEGAFGHEVAQQVGGAGAAVLGRRTFQDVIEALEDGSADLAVLPVHNSIAGPVEEVEQLLERVALRRLDEVVLPINQCLLVLPGSSIEGVREVRAGKQIVISVDAGSRDEALAEVERMCDQLLANPVIEVYSVTADTAEVTA